MMHFVYIIYSEKADQFYIGETENIENRLLKHNTGFFKNSFTAKTDDWKLFFSISYNNRIQAQNIEKHIKKMKSRKYIQNLKKYLNISKKLLLKY